MKKQIRKFAAIIVVAVMVMSFASCGGTDMSDSPYIGTWTATTAEYSGIEVSVESIFGGEFSFTLNEDGSCKLIVGEENETGKWSETETGFNVEDEFDFTVDGDSASLDYDGVSIYFERK